MFWSLAFGVAMGVGSYFAPAYVEQAINRFSSALPAPVQQQLNDSEKVEPSQPSHLTPYRIHGGVGPASSSI